MPRLKIAFVGAGSHVFGPSMLVQAFEENRLDGLELALADPNAESLELMAQIGRRIAAANGVSSTVSAVWPWNDALDGADFVLCCAAQGINRRFAQDVAIIDRRYPGHLVSEFGGVAGIAYTLRQLALIDRLVRDMKERCPRAVLLNISNPMPRLCQWAEHQGVASVGFCSVSLAGYGAIAEILDGTRERYPFAASRAKYVAKMGGTNHLSWLVELHERATGRDLLPDLRRRLIARNADSKCEFYGRETGFFLMSGDAHVQDFLPLDGLERSIESSAHGDEVSRTRREHTLRQVAAGDAPIAAIMDYESWERPFDLIRAVLDNRTARFESLNLANEGQIPQLPAGAFVETACTADRTGIRAEPLELPERVARFAQNAVEVTGAILEAFERRDPGSLKKALFLDPTVLDKELGWQALSECLAAHEDVIGPFAH